jgi:hypothetical protein
MHLISDDNGVDVILSPVCKDDGVVVNLDFNFSTRLVDQVESLSKDWHVEFRASNELIGSAKFSAYQFIADGVERRTIAVRYIEMVKHQRGQGKSYDLTKAIISTVNVDCDSAWGPAYGKPVLFFEKRDLDTVHPDERDGVFGFLRKIGETISGITHFPFSAPDHESVVSPVGDDVSIQLIHGHLTRSAKRVDRDPR